MNLAFFKGLYHPCTVIWWFLGMIYWVYHRLQSDPRPGWQCNWAVYPGRFAQGSGFEAARNCKKQVRQKRRYISDGSKSWRIEIKMVSQQIGIEICQPALVSPKISWVGQQQNQTLQDARAGRSAHRFQRSGRGPGLNALWNTWFVLAPKRLEDITKMRIEPTKNDTKRYKTGKWANCFFFVSDDPN